MECIAMTLERCKNICIKLRDKLSEELPELSMTNSNIQADIFDDSACCAVLELPDFYCCGEQCNFEVAAEFNDSACTTTCRPTCNASISGILSFNNYYCDIRDSFSDEHIEDIVKTFFIIIRDWVKNKHKKSYMVSINNPILKDSRCIVSKVMSLVSGDTMLVDIGKKNGLVPEYIINYDSVDIIDGSIDQIAVVFSADVTDENNNLLETVLIFNGFSNFIHKPNELSEAALDQNNFEIIQLSEGETINELPDHIYKRLRFCNDKLGVNASKFVGYSECDAFENMLLSDWMTLGGYGQAIIVNGEPD